jgi:hypothetical protein
MRSPQAQAFLAAMDAELLANAEASGMSLVLLVEYRIEILPHRHQPIEGQALRLYPSE